MKKAEVVNKIIEIFCEYNLLGLEEHDIEFQLYLDVTLIEINIGSLNETVPITYDLIHELSKIFNTKRIGILTKDLRHDNLINKLIIVTPIRVDALNYLQKRTINLYIGNSLI